MTLTFVLRKYLKYIILKLSTANNARKQQILVKFFWQMFHMLAEGIQYDNIESYKRWVQKHGVISNINIVRY